CWGKERSHMRKRFLGIATVVAALASIVIGVTPASAAVGWTVTPGGNATGTTDLTVLTVRPSNPALPDQVLDCLGSTAGINAFSSATSHVANINSITFNDCLLAGLITFNVVPTLPWQLHALSYSAPVVTGEIRNIKADIVGPGCRATVQGKVNG